jgi:nucleotide-binding universal stress UspA family protein
MPRLLMVPLDGSAYAEQALPLALAVARRSHAALHLVTVRASLPLGSAGTEEEEYLARIAGQMASELPGRITRRVLTNELGPLEFAPPAPDSVADVLARHAADHDVDLIITTTHGRGGLRRAWLGSVTDSLMRIASLPVLVIRPVDEHFGAAAAADRGLNHILIPLDGSAAAEQVIPFAQQMGEPFAARYTLLRVVSPLTGQVETGMYGSPPWFPPPSPLNRRAVQDHLDGLAAQLRASGMTVTTQVLDGTSAAAAILEYATTHAADLIALSTAGAGGVRRLLLGSVADKIVRSGDVPVLVCNVRHLHASAAPAGAGAAASGVPVAD